MTWYDEEQENYLNKNIINFTYCIADGVFLHAVLNNIKISRTISKIVPFEQMSARMGIVTKRRMNRTVTPRELAMM